MRFAALALFIIPAFAHDPTPPAIDEIFANFAKPESPGCSLGVIRDGNFIYRKGYGTASLELGVPLSSQSVFYMGSVSKQFTAAAVVLAAEQGFLSLDDNVRQYIPELPDYGHPVTLRQMLHHTSGLRDVLGLLYLSGRDATDLHAKPELIDLVARQKALNYNPGDEYLYSNSNYFLLAEVVQRATKKPFSEFVAENIFQPLGMTHTRFYDDHTMVVPGRIPAYQRGANGNFLVDWSTNFDKVGDGGLMSSVDDLLLWDRNFYANRLGKGTLLKEMQTRGVLNNGKQITYALGLEISSYRGLPIVEHGGALFGYRTEILRFPDQRFSVLCLCNLASASPGRLARQVADVYLAKDLQPMPQPFATPADAAISSPSQFAGKYFDRLNHSLLTFTISENTLAVDRTHLKRIAPNKFAYPGGETTVTFDSADGVSEASLAYDGGTEWTGTRIDDFHPPAAALSAYTGDYKSAELEATYKLSVEQGNLTLRVNWNPPVKLTAIVSNEFEAGGLGTFVFYNDANNHISGLSVFAGRIRNVVFEKTN